MLTVFAKISLIEKIEAIIGQEDRLDELVFVKADEDFDPALSNFHFFVREDGISLPLIWDNSLPPYLLPQEIEFTPANFLGLVFHVLENDQKSWEYLNGSELYSHLEIQNKLKYGLPISLEERPLSTYADWHNQAVLWHYGFVNSNIQANPVDYYVSAYEQATSDEHAAFSLKELATLYLDGGNLRKAEESINLGLQKAVSPEAKHALNLILVKIWMQQLVVPYEAPLLEKIKNKIWETLSFYEAKDPQSAQVGLLLLDATHIANISDSYTEALGYIRRAIDIFEFHAFDDLAGSAILRKGTLLYTWAQQGMPQFYKPAVESYQKALYTFTKERHPDVFADIHHNLAVLYSEMPAEPKKKSIWAGVASASFNEALAFFNKKEYPYQYGSICNNYGNALMKFPKAVHTDNYEKAIQYYLEALSVRTPNYPYERAITLLNYLGASWLVGNDPEVFNYMRFEDMYSKALEVKELVEDKDMIEEADKHLENLEKLRKASNYTA